jgi:hypothetical protein
MAKRHPLNNSGKPETLRQPRCDFREHLNVFKPQRAVKKEVAAHEKGVYRTGPMLILDARIVKQKSVCRSRIIR